MTEYEVKIGESTRSGLSVDTLAELFAVGSVSRETECRALPDGVWKTIDALFPLLEYRARRGGGMAATTVAPMPERATPPAQARNSAFRAGWICIAIGLAFAWIFPPANFFFSVAMVLSIVALCTHQVGRGFVLLFSAFAALSVSLFVSLILITGGLVAALQTIGDDQWASLKHVFTVPTKKALEELAVVPQPTPLPKPLPVATPYPRTIPARPTIARPTATPNQIPSVEQQIAREQRYRLAMDDYTKTKEMLAESIASRQKYIRNARYNGNSDLARIWEKELRDFREQEEKLTKPVY